jgi:polyribonucleotide nucleotidyltransferase
VRAHFAPSINIKIINTGIKVMGSKPKVVQQESAEEIERKATELAQKETNEANAAKRKQKKSTALGSLSESSLTALSAPKINTGT